MCGFLATSDGNHPPNCIALTNFGTLVRQLSDELMLYLASQAGAVDV
jgi:hypothetical protein